MPTAGDVARAALGDLAVAPPGPGHLNALRWVHERYTEVCALRLRHRRVLGEVIVPGAVVAGTVTCTRGSQVVTGDATAQAAWSDALTGRYFKSRVAWYVIESFDGTTLTLASPFAEDTVTAGGYVVVARTVALADDLAFLGDVVHPRCYTGRPLDQMSRMALDLEEPNRTYSTGGPRCVVDLGEADGRTIVEVYPYSLRDELLQYVYWSRPPQFEDTDLLPSTITTVDLKAGVIIDACRWMASRTMQDGKADTAGFWLNWASRQESVWDRAKQNIHRRDRGIESLAIMLRSPVSTRGRIIRTAHDEVYARS